MSEWKEYNGSPSQVDSITQSKTDIAYILGNEQYSMPPCRDRRVVKNVLLCASHYLICNPHPLADMICQQARTCQPVWVRKLFECGIEKEWQMFVTTTPDWNIPNAEYSFTEFKEEV